MVLVTNQNAGFAQRLIYEMLNLHLIQKAITLKYLNEKKDGSISKYSVNPVRFFRIFTSLTKGMLFFSKEKSSLCL